MNYLQQLIDDTDPHGLLDIRGQEFQVDGPTNVVNPIAIVGGEITVTAPFNGSVLDIAADATVLDSVRIYGPGASLEITRGINVRSQASLRNCHVEDIEYCLYFFDAGSDGSRMVGCSGRQDPLLFLHPWKGLDYGIILNECTDVQVRGCNIDATRHAAIFGHGTKDCRVTDSWLKSNANVNCVSFKPDMPDGRTASENCTLSNCDIYGGINIAGLRQRIADNNVHGNLDETYPSMASTCLYGWTTSIVDYNHTVTGNLFVTGTTTYSTEHGAIYVWCGGSYPNAGDPVFTNNRIVITGDAPAVVGMFEEFGVVPESLVIAKGNIIERV